LSRFSKESAPTRSIKSARAFVKLIQEAMNLSELDEESVIIEVKPVKFEPNQISLDELEQ